MRFISISVLSVAMSLFWVTSPYCQDDDVNVDDLVYMTEEYRPYNFVKNNQLTGISVELLKLIWAEMSYAEQPIHVYPWARGYLYLQNRKNHVLFATAQTEKRKDLFKWVGPIYKLKLVLVARADAKIQIGSIDEIKNYQIGTIIEDVAEQSLLEIGIRSDNIQPVRSLEQNFMKLKLNRVDLVAISDKTLNAAFNNGDYRAEDFKTVYAVRDVKSYYAFHRDIPDSLINKFQNALDSLYPQHQAILNKYFHKEKQR